MVGAAVGGLVLHFEAVVVGANRRLASVAARGRMLDFIIAAKGGWRMILMG
jgi:hypothetical protein